VCPSEDKGTLAVRGICRNRHSSAMIGEERLHMIRTEMADAQFESAAATVQQGAFSMRLSSCSDISLRNAFQLESHCAVCIKM
jgi:hypothetical protein